MRRGIVLGIIVFLAIGVAGCGKKIESDDKKSVVTESGTTEPETEPEITEAVQQQETDAEKNTDIGQSVVYESENWHLSLQLPDNWDYQIQSEEALEKEDGLYTCAIRFWPKDYPEEIFVLAYQTAFGMCGTGVTIEEISLDNGLSGYRYTEEIENTLWLTITLTPPDWNIQGGTFLVTGSPSVEDWKILQPEFEKILQTIWVGKPEKQDDETIKVPLKEEILEKRQSCLNGMSEEEITRLAENIKTANLQLEYGYLNDKLFERLEDKDDLYWNYIDEKGDIIIGYTEEDGEQEPIVVYNRFDADNFIDLMEEMKNLLQADGLQDDFDHLIEYTRQAKETHDVKYIIEIYHILHDMDYFLLRYAPEDIAPYVRDRGTIGTYYGALEVYKQEK